MGVLERFASKIQQRKKVLQTEHKQARAAKQDIRKREKAEYLRALRKEKLAYARKKAKADALPLGYRAGKALKTAGKELRKYQKTVAKRNKTKKGTGFVGPNVGTPQDKDLFEVKDFRK